MADDPPAFNLDDIDFGPTMRGHQKGDRVFDRFVLQKLLGRGGMGVVWLALDERLRRDVALKFAPQLIRFDEVAVEELKEETRKGLELSHPHIVKTYDFLLDEEHAAISMEFIDGESLAGKRAKQPKKVFEVRELEAWAAQLLDALQYAHHHAGVIHRDLKPANLMVDRHGALKITDFGIARSITDAINRATLAIGNSTGTLAYMSPQQADGRKPEISDDLYAFASTMYELLTGKPPFHSGNIGLQLRHEAPAPLSERRQEFGIQDAEAIPSIWEETLLACLSKDPAQRPASAADIAQLLSLAPHHTRTISTDTLRSVQASVVATSQGSSPSNHRSTSSQESQREIHPSTGANRGERPSAPAQDKPWRQVAPAAASIPDQADGSATTPRAVSDTSPTVSSSNGHLWLWIVLLLMFVAMVTCGAAGWWIYKNGSLFKKTSPNEVNIAKSEDVTNQGNANLSSPDSSPDIVDQTSSQEPAAISMDPPPTPKKEEDPSPLRPDSNPAITAAFTTIQNAISRAKAGDTITIPDGIYQEQLRLVTGIRLKAQNVGKVIVQAEGEDGSALLAENVRDASIEGLVFQHTGSEVAAKRTWPVVYLKSSSVQINACTIEKGVGDGLVVTGSGKVEIRQSLFRNNFGHGLVIESGATPVVVQCESHKNGGNGVTVRFTGTFPVLEHGEFNHNGGSGLVVHDRASVKITGDTVASENVEAGFATDGEGASLQIDGATCSKNLVGISVQNAATGAIRNAKVIANKESGIVFDGASNQSMAEKIVSEQNKGDGIFATGPEDSSLKLLGNQTKGNGGYGILVFGRGFKPEVMENVCSSNAQHGIFAAEGCAAIISANSVQGNHLPGIKVEDSPQTILRDNLLD